MCFRKGGLTDFHYCCIFTKNIWQHVPTMTCDTMHPWCNMIWGSSLRNCRGLIFSKFEITLNVKNKILILLPKSLLENWPPLHLHVYPFRHFYTYVVTQKMYFLLPHNKRDCIICTSAPFLYFKLTSHGHHAVTVHEIYLILSKDEYSIH